MRIKDLKPNTLYATCDGAMVMTTDDLKADWYMRDGAVKDGKRTLEWERGSQVHDGTDPWGGCKTGGSRPSARAGWNGPGLKVIQYAFDRDGEMIPDQHALTIVKPKDLPGTWLQYMSLHADTVREGWDKRDLNKRCSELHKDLHGRMREILGADLADERKDGGSRHSTGLYVEVGQVYTYADGKVSSWYDKNKRIKAMEAWPSITVSGPAVERLLELLEPKKPARKRTVTKKGSKS